MSGHLRDGGWRDRPVKEALDPCLSCTGCTGEPQPPGQRRTAAATRYALLVALFVASLSALLSVLLSVLLFEPLSALLFEPLSARSPSCSSCRGAVAEYFVLRYNYYEWSFVPGGHSWRRRPPSHRSDDNGSR